MATFVLLPEAAAAAIFIFSSDGPALASAGLIAGVGVFGGLLFQVTAWISGRLGSISDGIGDRAPTERKMMLLGRLDLARANLVYATLVSILFVVELGVVMAIDQPPRWVDFISLFILFHLALTLILVLQRINRIGKVDWVDTVTAETRRSDREHAA